VVGNQYFDFRVMGEPGRLIPELELVIFLAAALLFAWMSRRAMWLRVAAVIVSLACLVPGIGYMRNAWRVMPPRDNSHRQRVEYVITSWMHDHLDGVRTLATGSVRFWYNAWYDLPQLGGGSQQGLLNINSEFAQVNAIANDDVAVGIDWLKAMGVGAVIVNGRNSTEVYHDWTHPDKFEGKLPKVYDENNDRIYLVPRRYPALARVVLSIPPAGLRSYVDAVEQGPEAPVALQWTGTDAMRIQARLTPGQRLLVQESYDPAFRAYVGGRRIPITKDAFGFMLLDPGPGDRDVLLRFETPLENRIGTGLTVISLLILALLVWRS
jgi:hypothetical protein